jgi:hypothetical protein
MRIHLLEAPRVNSSVKLSASTVPAPALLSEVAPASPVVVPVPLLVEAAATVTFVKFSGNVTV